VVLRLLIIAVIILVIVALVAWAIRSPVSMSQSNRKSPEDKAVDDMQGFLQHLGAYGIVISMLFVINLVTSRDSWWFLWVAFFWGVGLAFHAFDLFIGENKELARRLAKRRMRSQVDVVERESAGNGTAVRGTAEITGIVRQGSRLVDQMRADARMIPRSEPRREALAACAAADQVLSAIEDHPDEIVLARDFLHRFLEPGSTLVRDYARLASRDVPSARETVAEVEATDLPALTRRANAIYDRLHRGTLIDLEVAREMMALDVPIQPPAAIDSGNGEAGRD
jgi:hypothetical protein